MDQQLTEFPRWPMPSFVPYLIVLAALVWYVPRGLRRGVVASISDLIVSFVSLLVAAHLAEPATGVIPHSLQLPANLGLAASFVLIWFGVGYVLGIVVH